MGTPSRYGLTNKVKLLPSRRTTYVGGKNIVFVTLRYKVHVLDRLVDGSDEF